MDHGWRESRLPSLARVLLCLVRVVVTWVSWAVRYLDKPGWRAVVLVYYLTETLIGARIYFLWQKCVSLTETWTETCFCEGNVFSEGIFFSDRHLCLTKTCFCDINFFSVTEFCFCHRKFFCCSNLFLGQKLVLSKILFFGHFFYVISREKFPWEMGVSVILDNQDNHFVEPCNPTPPIPLFSQLFKNVTLFHDISQFLHSFSKNFTLFAQFFTIDHRLKKKKKVL